MKKNIIKISFVISIIFNILSFTKLSSDYIYYLKFILPSLSTFLIFILYYQDLKVRRYSFRYFLIISLVLISGLFMTKNLVESFLEYISLIVLLLNTIVLFPAIFSGQKESSDIYKLIFNTYFYSIIIIVFLSIFLFKDTYYIALPSYRKRYNFYFTNPNSLGTFTFYSLTISMFFVNRKDYKLFFKMIVLFIILYLTDARTAFYSLIFSMFLRVMFNRFKDKKKLLNFKNQAKLTSFVIIPMLIIVSIFLLLNTNYDNINQLLSGRLDSINKTFSNYNFIDHVFGVGFGQKRDNPHNAMLLILSEVGIVGFIGVYYMIVKVLFYKSFKTHNFYNYLLMKFLIISFLIYGMFESVIITPGNFNTFIIWFTVGLMIEEIEKAKNNKEDVNEKIESYDSSGY